MVSPAQALLPTASATSSRVLVTGATGLLGRQVMRNFQVEGWQVLGVGYSRAGGAVAKCNLLNESELADTFAAFRPTLVVHCAAERRPDKLENDLAAAEAINVDVTRNIAQICRLYGSWLVFLSTNYVFDGKQAPYDENALPCPLNVYGQSKLAGEKAVAEVLPAAAIVRVPLLYGPIESVGETSVTSILESLSQTAPKLDNWQERFPTSTQDVAAVLQAFSAKYVRFGRTDPSSFSGIFHWQANERHTKYTMGLEIARIADVDSTKIVRVDDAPPPSAAPRPQFERMLCGRLEKLLQIEGDPTAYRSSFSETLQQCLQPFVIEHPTLPVLLAKQSGNGLASQSKELQRLSLDAALPCTALLALGRRQYDTSVRKAYCDRKPLQVLYSIIALFLSIATFGFASTFLDVAYNKAASRRLSV